MLTFLPKCLYEQFHRRRHFYFLVAAILSVSLSPLFNKWSMIAPLVFVVGLAMGKRRRGGRSVSGMLCELIKMSSFLLDLLLLSSSYDDGICYVETMNLDGRLT
ncbi:Phospholipid-transporting ATPase 6 [Raphanus sativus]|nr:Phospholipid-transporting ATPase 6 [Raphanus sativus]